MKVYRILVTHWPTDDGQPWPRFVSALAPDEVDPWQHPVQPWMLPLVYEDFSGMDEFRRDHPDPGDNTPIGWVMPNPRGATKLWLSRSSAVKWMDAAEQWGAVCRLIESDPITWPGEQ